MPFSHQLLGNDCTEIAAKKTPANLNLSAQYSRKHYGNEYKNSRRSAPKERFMSLNRFSKLGLYAPLADALEKLGITTPTEIQTKAIPHALAGRDLMATAETGSGKTLAFLLPMIQRLSRPGATRALVLAPTRELALQIEANAKTYGAAARLRTAAVVGGQSLQKQTRALRSGVDILVATPGRLNDLIERASVQLKTIDVLVLDEADRMLDMGFLPQVRRIIKHLPKARQTMLLTATLSREVERLAQELLRLRES